VLDDLGELENVSAPGCPSSAETNISTGAAAGEQQYSIYVRHGWPAPGQVAKDQRLIDPATLGRDPNTSVYLFDVSRDGTLLAYAVQQGGADESGIHFLNVKTGKTLEDELPWPLFQRELCAGWRQHLLLAQ